MNRIRLHRILPVLVLGALLMAPSSWAAPRGELAGPMRAEGTWAVSWDFFSQLWSRAIHWASKNGLSIDPDGTSDSRPMNGPGIDPNGGFPMGTKNGPTIDPDGHTSASVPNPHGGSCVLDSSGCGL